MSEKTCFGLGILNRAPREPSHKHHQNEGTYLSLGTIAFWGSLAPAGLHACTEQR